MTRILILTASFGEGHNTAARNIRVALETDFNGQVEVRVVDLYALTNPRINRVMQKGYRIAISRATTLWRAIFQLLDRPGMLERSLPLIARMRKAADKLVAEFQPSIIVSTYPLYSFLIAELAKQGRPLGVPLVTVVTDSTEINTAWFRCESDAFVVADHATAERLIEGGVREEKIHELGFPVDRSFDQLQPLSIDAPPPWKILFMPSSRRGYALRTAQFLCARDNVELTILTGNDEQLRAALAAAGISGLPNCTIRSWTDEMPALLASHHLFLGKAGGAITQEALAAGCPIMINHVVPGQEEGNIGFILHHQIGALANTPELLQLQLEGAFGGGAIGWKRWKRNIVALRRPGASAAIARFLIDRAAA